MHVLTVDFKAPNAAEVFVESLINTGFAVLKNHPINQTSISDTYDDWVRFFSSQEKFNYLFDKEKQDGYFPASVSEIAKNNKIKDIKEFYQIYPWGRYPVGISNHTKLLYADLASLAGELLCWIEKLTPHDIATNFSRPLSDMILGSPNTMLRILHYPPLTGAEEQGAIRAAAHEDINLITLLPAATAPGLQVKDVRGVWHDVECDPGMIVVNTGDMLQMCSKGYYPSTSHRVINPENSLLNKSRLSMPLFLHPHDEVRLSESYTANQYLIERLTELGLY